MSGKELPPVLTPREREIVEIVREFANLLRAEFSREMRAYHLEQRQIVRDLFNELHRELYGFNREAAAQMQRECDEFTASHFPSKQT